MNKVLEYLLKVLKSKSTYFLAGTVVLDIIALILYVNFGLSIFIPELSGAVIALLVLGIVLPFVVAFSPVKLAYVALYIINLFACFKFLASQASFIANVFVGIDGTSFSAAFIFTVILTLAAGVLTLVAMHFVSEDVAGKPAPDSIEAPEPAEEVQA